MKQIASKELAGTLTIEQVSVLLDGEMDRAEAEDAIAAVCADAALLKQWHELHRVGDALRSNEVAACDSEGFCSRVRSALATEPTILAPRASSASRASGARAWMPGLAVAASVAAVAFIAVPLLRAPQTSIARIAEPVGTAVATLDPAAQKALPAIANARGLSPSLNPYLAAHRELIGNSVVPRAAVYLRSGEDR